LLASLASYVCLFISAVTAAAASFEALAFCSASAYFFIWSIAGATSAGLPTVAAIIFSFGV